MKLSLVIFATLFSQIGFIKQANAWTVLVVSGNGGATIKGQPLKVGMNLKLGDAVKTAAGVKVKLQEGFSIMVIGEKSELAIELSDVPKIKLVSNDSEKLEQIALKNGVVRFQIDKKEATKFRYRIPSVVAGVRGTQFFMSASPEKEVLCVIEGEVGAKIVHSGAEAKVEKNIGWIREGNKDGVLVKTSDEQRSKWVEATDIAASGVQ